MKRLLAVLFLTIFSASAHAYQYGAKTATGSASIVVDTSRGRTGVAICNNDSSASIYVGLDSSLTSSNGLTIKAGTCYSASAPQEVWKGPLYVITGGGSIDVRYQEYGVGDVQ